MRKTKTYLHPEALLAVAGLLAFPGIAQAQGAPSNDPITLPWINNTDDFDEIVTGDFDNDGHIDIVVRSGGEVRLARAVAIFEDIGEPLATDATAILNFPRLGQDRLVISDSAGFSYWEPAGGMSRVQVVDPLMAGAVELKSAGGRLMARSSSGAVSFRISPWAPGGSTLFQAAGVRAMTGVHWDDQVPEELAILTTTHIEIYSTNGTLLESIPATNIGGSLAAIDNAGTLQQRVAALVHLSNGYQYLGVTYLDPSGTLVIEPPAVVGVGQIISMHSIANTLPGALGSDLALFDDSALTIRTYHHSGNINPSGYTFRLANSTLEDLVDDPFTADPAAGNRISAADMDSDGDLDLCVGLEFIQQGVAQRQITVLTNGAVDADDLRSAVIAGPNCGFTWHYPAGVAVADLPVEADPGLDGTLTLSLQAPLLGYWDAIEWTAYRADYDAEEDILSPMDLQNPITGGVIHSLVSLEMDLPSSNFIAELFGTVPLVEATGFVGDLYGIEFHPVALDAQNEVIGRGPSTLYSFTTDDIVFNLAVNSAEAIVSNLSCLIFGLVPPTEQSNASGGGGGGGGGAGNGGDLRPREERVQGGGVGPQPKFPPPGSDTGGGG